LTQQHIYHLNEQGRLEPMQEEPFAAEDKLQELVADYPGLLSGEQMNPAHPRRFILIGREQGIADIIGGGHRWSLDHLLIDQDAIPTLVEAKRQANSEIRREIVGQMMDYAAHATQTWNVGDIRQAFEERVSAAGQDPDIVLSELLQAEGETDSDAFWQQVETNLRAARLRLLFVADGIPEELTRVVEFLNEQMPGIEVLAVEIKQFRGETDSSVLVPRVIGRTAGSVATRGRNLTEQTFLDSFDGEIRPVSERFLQVARQYDARCNWLKDAVNINFQCVSPKESIRIARLCIPGITGWGVAEGFFLGINENKELPPNLQEVLGKWHNEFSTDEFAKPISGLGCKAYAISHQDAAANIELLAERLERVLRELRELPAGE